MPDSTQNKRLRASAPTQTIHDLSLMEDACINALAGEQEYPGGMAEFHSVVDPASALHVVRIAKSALSEEERQELGRLMAELTFYVKVVPDDNGAAASIDRDELILRARRFLSSIGM